MDYINMEKAIKRLEKDTHNHKDGLKGLAKRRKQLLSILREKNLSEDIRRKVVSLLPENPVKAILSEKNKKLEEVNYIYIPSYENPKLRDDEVKSHTWLPLGEEDFEYEVITVTLTNFKSYEKGDVHAHPGEEISSVFSGEILFEIPNRIVFKVGEGKYAAFSPYLNHNYIFEGREPTFVTTVKPPEIGGEKIKGTNKGNFYVRPMMTKSGIIANAPLFKVLEMVLKGASYEDNEYSIKGVFSLTEVKLHVKGETLTLHPLDLLVTQKPIKIEKMKEGLVYVAKLI